MPRKNNTNRGGNRIWINNDGDNRGPRDARHDGGKHYFDHDIRDLRGADMTRRVSFKPGSGSRIGKQKRGHQVDWDAAIQARLANTSDGDIDMSTNAFGPQSKRGARYNPYLGRARGRGGSRGRGGRVDTHHSNGLTQGSTCWYKITIPHAAKLDRNFVLTNLQTFIAPTVMVPYVYKVSGEEASFFVDSYDLASSLLTADRRISTPDGYKMLVRARPNFPPCRLEPGLKDLLKLVMSRRYNAANNALDLERLHADPGLADHPDSVVVLCRQDVITAVVDIIATNIPQLVALNLGSNDISSIDSLSALTDKLPNLVVLHLAGNKIRDVRQLDCLKPLKLVDLLLQGNPLVKKFTERTSYVREVQSRFPKLVKLDGEDVPPMITFEDVEEEVTGVPPFAGSFLVDPSGRDFLRQFLEQYVRIYDADDRSPLADAYHDVAVFSMTCANVCSGKAATRSLATYVPLSRNILKVNNPVRRNKQLIRGRANIVAFLCSLPRTLHDALSFAVDMPIYTPGLIQVNVSGMMREVGTDAQHLRTFSRVFVVVPVGTGFCIVNETLFISNVTDQQEKAAFQAPPPALAPPLAPAPSAVDAEVRQRMVATVHQQTGMNVSWATKCLEETQWNFELALTTFAELNKNNQIPAEAFAKIG